MAVVAPRLAPQSLRLRQYRLNGGRSRKAPHVGWPVASSSLQALGVDPAALMAPPAAARNRGGGACGSAGFISDILVAKPVR